MRESRWLPSLLRSSESNDFGDLFLCPYVAWHPVGGALVSSAPTEAWLVQQRAHLSQVHQPKLGWCNRGLICLKCTNRSVVGAAETAAPPDPGKSRVSPGNYIAKINGVHREVMLLASPFHNPCRLQYSRADTSLASVRKIASGFSPGCSSWRSTSVGVSNSIHWI